MRTLKALTFILLWLVGAHAANAANIERVSLVTCGPGSEIYELEGHTALRLQFDDGTDLSVNWGTFDFNSPNFLYRFVKGETDYRMAVYPYPYFLEQYRAEGRWLKEWELNLTRPQKERLVNLIDSTLTKGSAVYRYNYVKDNCATRPLDYIEKAIGGTIELGPELGLPSGADTFRRDMAFYHANYPWYQFGIDMALGSGIDYTLTHKEHRFAPTALDNMLAGAYLTTPDGTRTALVQPPQTILPENGGGPLPPTPWPLTPLFVCWLFFAATLLVCINDIKRKKITRWYSSLYYSLTFVAGLLLTFLIFISVHEATSPNWLFLWLNPLCVIGAVGLWLKKFKKAVFWWQIVNFVALTALTAIAVMGVQRLNAAFYPLIASDALLAATYIALNQVSFKRLCNIKE